MSDDVDEFTKHRLRREQRRRAGKPEQSATDRLYDDLVNEKLFDLIAGGADAYLDYEACIDAITEKILPSLLQAGALRLAYEREQGAEEAELAAAAPDIESTCRSLARGLAEKLVQDEIEELQRPDIRVVVIPLDGGPPDATYEPLVNEFARKSLGREAAIVQRNLHELQTKLRELPRPALVFEMSDTYLHEFKLIVQEEPEDPQVS